MAGLTQMDKSAAAEQAGVVSICVRDPHETKRVIQMSIACLSDRGRLALCS